MHVEALTKESRELFSQCRAFKNFYLVGGTALALQIGHRLSVDLDFFTKQPLPKNLLAKLKRVFPDQKLVVTYRSSEQLSIIVHGVKMTFFQYPYPVLYRYKKYLEVSLATIQEIAAMKAFALGKRLAYKDYVDWYFLLSEQHVKLKDVIRIARKKFGEDFNDRLFLGQLVSFEDVSFQEINFLRHPVERKTIEDFLRKTIQMFRL